MSLDEISRNVIGLKKNLETVFTNHEAYIWNEKKATNDTQLKPVKILNNQVFIFVLSVQLNYNQNWIFC